MWKRVGNHSVLSLTYLFRRSLFPRWSMITDHLQIKPESSVCLTVKLKGNWKFPLQTSTEVKVKTFTSVINSSPKCNDFLAVDLHSIWLSTSITIFFPRSTTGLRFMLWTWFFEESSGLSPLDCPYSWLSSFRFYQYWWVWGNLLKCFFLGWSWKAFLQTGSLPLVVSAPILVLFVFWVAEKICRMASQRHVDKSDNINDARKW